MSKATSTKKEQPIILITNDDGITAPGIKALTEAVKGLGKIVVVAPDKPQSGMGHAITIGQPLRLHKVTPIVEGVESWSLSGVNHGANNSINVIYSGTMSAALEAAIESIPSIGFSLLDYSIEADFTAAKKYVRLIVEQILKSKQLDKHLCLNVNIPKGDEKLIKGVKICHQAYAKYEEKFDERKDPHGKKYFWLTGEFVNFDKSKESDVWALKHNYVSVVPVQFDLTNYELKKKLEKSLNFKA
jgi:5'-nucleotidase